MKIKLLLAISVIILFYTNSNSQEAPVRIAFIGNSITFGSGLTQPEKECYPARFTELMNNYYDSSICSIKNFAVSGRTMLRNGNSPIWNEPEFDSSLSFNPDIVVITLGTNDTKPFNWDKYGNEFVTDYLLMIDTFKVIKPDIKFIVCYPPPAFNDNWGIRDSVIVQGVIPAIDSVISVTKAYLIDFHSEMRNCHYFFPDNIHPNTEGSLIMAKIVFDFFIDNELTNSNKIDLR